MMGDGLETSPPPTGAASEAPLTESGGGGGESAPAPPSTQGRKIFCGSIAEVVQKRELKSEFEKFGDVEELYLGPGYAFITFAR